MLTNQKRRKKFTPVSSKKQPQGDTDSKLRKPFSPQKYITNNMSKEFIIKTLRQIHVIHKEDVHSSEAFERMFFCAKLHLFPKSLQNFKFYL